MQVAKTGAQLRLQQDTAQKAASALPKAQVEQSKEELWAKEGIEQMAGKGWQAMEEEQRTLQQHRIDARVQAALGRKPVSALYQPIAIIASLATAATSIAEIM